MKRSEMLSVLLNELIDWTAIDWNLTKEEQEDAVDAILIGIEEAGMLPPKECRYDALHKINKWEPEDE